jgi:hypothetical protein
VFVEQENITCTLKWPSVIAKNGKKSSLYKEKSLVGLTPRVNPIKFKFCIDILIYESKW